MYTETRRPHWREGETEKERGRKGNGILQCSFGIVLTFFILENVRVLLVNDDATVAGFSETERKQGFLLFKPFIRYRWLELERFPLFPRFLLFFPPPLFSIPVPTSLRRFSLFSRSFLVRRRRGLVLEINGNEMSVLMRAVSANFEIREIEPNN